MTENLADSLEKIVSKQSKDDDQEFLDSWSTISNNCMNGNVNN
ncbi:hypothetical protein [Oenococcus sp.]